MRNTFLVSTFILSIVLTACGGQSVAGKYKANLAAGEGGAGSEEIADGAGDKATGDEATADEGGEGDAAAGDGEAAAGDGEAPAGDGEAPAGDAEAGKTLLTQCAGCHNANGPGKNVTLDKTATAKLTNAYEGPAKANHAALSAVFEDGRADLEAALNAI